MNVTELSKQLTKSVTQFNQSKFLPWWEDDFENATYRYDIFPADEVAQIEECLALCPKEDLLSPTGISGGYGLSLFHLLVWHNFYDAVKAMLEDGRVSGSDLDTTDDKGLGLTALLLACCRGNLAMARLLLEHGADASLSDQQGKNGFHFLAYPRIEGFANSHMEKTALQREAIARLLTCDVNQKDQNGLTPLALLLSSSYSSEYSWPLTGVFLDQGAETSYIDDNGNSLLMLAMKNGHMTAAVQLMQRSQNLVTLANKDGVTPMQHAYDWHSEGLCLALADYGATLVDSTPMELSYLSQITSNAFCTRSEEDLDGISLALYLTEKLISQLDPDDEDEIGYVTDILHNALQSDPRLQVLEVCQKAGLDFTMPLHFRGSITCLRDECLGIGYGVQVIRKLLELGVDMDSGVVKGRTPAYLVASKRAAMAFSQSYTQYFQEAARLLSKESMEQLGENGMAAIHMAAQNGHADMLAVMIEKGVDLNLSEDSPAQPGTTPLHEACAYGHANVVRLLVEAGADDTRKNSKGETPAHCALRKQRFGKEWTNEERAQVLKELVHLDLPDENGRTPLMLSQLLNLTLPKDLFPVFLEKGVEVNRTDKWGMTALMLNTQNSCFKDVVKLLLTAGADLHISDNEGNTALFYALENGDSEVSRYLIKKGADYNKPNNDGKTPVQIAVEQGLDTVLELMTDIQ